MPLEGDKFDLGKTIGSIESSVGSIRSTVDKVNSKVDSLGDKLNHLSHAAVKKTECSESCGRVVRKVDSLKVELVGIRGDLSKKQTRQEVPTVPRIAAAGSRTSSNIISPTFEDLSVSVPSKNILQRLKDNALAVTAIVGLITLVGAGFLNLARFVVRVENVLEENKKVTKAQTKKLEKEIRRIDEVKSRIVYIPVKPDAGLPSRIRSRASRRTRRARVRAASPAAPVGP